MSIGGGKMKNLIREKREALKLSQVRLATLTGLANGYISDFELGKREPWPRARKALARALGTTESELFPQEVARGC
jgi:transcriptional regulator with XRE-family HTH domain